MITKTQLYLLSKLPEKLLNRISINEHGCWLWQGELNRNGYGRVWVNGKRLMTHRVVYELTHCHIKEGLLLDHLCRNRCCCNPCHLSPVIASHNVRRGKAVLFKK